LHANSTFVDRVDLATPLSLSSQRLPAPRLLLPRSGLSRSDFVRWPQAAVRRCLLFRRCQGISRHSANGPTTTLLTHFGHVPHCISVAKLRKLAATKIKLTRSRLEPAPRRSSAPERGLLAVGASADFLEARPPARHLDRRQHVAFAFGRDRQRLPGAQKI
jgi:hypothetical protein